MTEKELEVLEAELQKCGYKKWTTCLTSTESYAWFKSFGKEKDEDGNVISGYQVAFRVWDWRPYQHRDKNMPPYGFDFWTSPLGKQEKNADTVIQGWVAKGEEGDVSVFQNKPTRNTGLTYGFWDDGSGCPIDLPKESFPDLTWESDPEPVEIIIKRKKNG